MKMNHSHMKTKPETRNNSGAIFGKKQTMKTSTDKISLHTYVSTAFNRILQNKYKPKNLTIRVLYFRVSSILGMNSSQHKQPLPFQLQSNNRIYAKCP